MAATNPASSDLRAVLNACPEAFAAVDPDLNVVEWNPAATALTGYAAEDVLGRPLPHLTPAQLGELAGTLPAFDTWSRDVPVVLPRQHADGHIIQVCVTAYIRMEDADGSTTGYGSFFRPVRVSDRRVAARNVYSRTLAESIRVSDVSDALDLALAELLQGDAVYLVSLGEDPWAVTLAAGEGRDGTELTAIAAPDQLRARIGEGQSAVIDVTIAEQTHTALAVPAGGIGATSALLLLGEGVDSLDVEGEDLLSAIGSEVTSALARVEALTGLEDKLEILEAIAGVAQATGLPEPELISHIVSHAASALSCERAALYLIDEDGGLTLEESTFSTDPDDLAAEEGDRVAQEIFDAGGLFLAQSTGECPWLGGPWAQEHGAVSVMGMPLRVAERAVGLLVVAHTVNDPRGFTPLCTQVATSLAGQAALALSNAGLMRTEAEANRALHEMNRRRADYVEGITHDLRTPITAVLGFAKTLRRAGDQLSAGDRVEALATIERQALRVSRMLDDMMDSARADAGELQPDQLVATPLHHVVSEALLIAAPEQRSRLSASCDPTVVAYGDSDQLTRVVQNLIGNALRYAPGQTPIEVVVERRNGMAQMLVIDHGPGMPPGIDPFERFSRGDGRGTGLGLYTVRSMVQAHGGTVNLVDTEGGGTTVEVLLPVYSGRPTAGS